jgi:hypothetical protein
MVINFCEATQLRNFELVLDDGSLFVNPYYLAEISPYFNRLCFANFRETEQNYVKMEVCFNLTLLYTFLGNLRRRYARIVEMRLSR